MPWLAAGIGAGANIIGSILGTNTTKKLPGNLQAAQNSLLGYYTGILNNPSSGMQPMLNSGIDQINQNYAALPDQMSRQLAARGFGKSGKLGTAMYNTGSARLNDISNFQSQFNQMVLNRQMQAASGESGLVNAGYGINQGGIGAGLLAAGSEFGGLAKSLAQQPQQPQDPTLDPNFLYYDQANPFSDPGWNGISGQMLGVPSGGGYIPSAPAAPGYTPTPFPSGIGNGMPSV